MHPALIATGRRAFGWRRWPAGSIPMERLSAPERTREELRALMNGELGTAAAGASAVRLIVDDALAGEPPRTAVRRGTAKAENHSQWLRREAGAQAHVRRPHPSRRTMARSALHRVRAPTDRRCQKRTRRRISRFNHAAGPVSPAPSFQQIQALTRLQARRQVVGGMSEYAAYVQTPTIHYVPVQGQQLIQQITTPITTDTLSSLYNYNCRSQIYCSLQPHE